MYRVLDEWLELIFFLFSYTRTHERGDEQQIGDNFQLSEAKWRLKSSKCPSHKPIWNQFQCF